MRIVEEEKGIDLIPLPTRILDRGPPVAMCDGVWVFNAMGVGIMEGLRIAGPKVWFGHYTTVLVSRTRPYLSRNAHVYGRSFTW